MDNNSKLQTLPLVLVGLGPHAKRIYLHFLIKNGFLPSLIVELASQKAIVEKFLAENNLNVPALYFDDSVRGLRELSSKQKTQLLHSLTKLHIKKAIISTEPRDHMSYAKFFIEKNINILMDKPVSAPVGLTTSLEGAKEIYKNYLELKSLLENKPALSFSLQVQRRFHPGYRFVYETLQSVIETHRVPITFIDIYHADGMWNMPEEFSVRENHPYKYGYGKLMHSGYHFFDLFAWFSGLNLTLENKLPNQVSVYQEFLRPNDFFFQVDQKNYDKLFADKTPRIPQDSLPNFGEIDSHTLIKLSHDNKTILTGSLNLLQNSFSRRAWPELPSDTYKSNGRVRHERVNIQVGPLLNIQVHSYQAYEVKEKVTPEDQQGVGGIEHFDIYIFRNSALIGGKAFEKLTIRQIVNHNKKSYLGHNENAREDLILKFISTSDNKYGNYMGQQATNYYLSLACEAAFKGAASGSPYLKESLDLDAAKAC